MMEKAGKTLVAVDTGGTFTDFYVISPREVRSHKVLSTPKDPSRAILQGLRELKVKNFELVHGSTVATNALLERKGARVALITTAGFEDVLEIGRQNRSGLYDLQVSRPEPLVPKSRRWGVRERIDPWGKVLEKFDAEELRGILRKLKSKRIESVAVCLLFSYANADHEKKIKRALARAGLPLSLSHEICPEYREYERSSTTCLNAYVSPKMSSYLNRLAAKLPSLRVMQSNGGSLSAHQAGTEAVRTLLSGPAGGALGAWRRASEAGVKRVLSFDMGGTSTDLSLIDGGLELTTEAEIAGYPVKTPMIRIDTIGAGGGSLAWMDAGGALRVGPQSAGASPGPICYGLGGKIVTVTDAHVFLGRIPPRLFLGGRMSLHPQKILVPLKALAKKCRLSPERCAEGILEVANANMARALRVLSMQRGYDPRRFALLGFGGAGGLHACELAELLGMRQVLIPPSPGVLSADGMAHADWVRDDVRTVLKQKPGRIPGLLREMKTLAKQAARREGLALDRVKFAAGLDLRYAGQSFEITLPVSANYRKAFAIAHRRRYGFLHKGRPVEIVNLRLQARVPRNFLASAKISEPRSTTIEDIVQRLHWRGKNWDCPVLWRDGIKAWKNIPGPAIVAESSATTFVPPGWKGRVDARGNFEITQR